MSGLEAAGVALGAISVLIGLIEGQETALDKLWAFGHWKVVLGRTRRGLRILTASYELSISTLYAPLTTRTELDTMMADSQCALWRSP
jgi:hypothetical protein